MSKSKDEYEESEKDIVKTVINDFDFIPVSESEDMSDVVYVHESKKILMNNNFYIRMVMTIIPSKEDVWEIISSIETTTGDIHLLPYYIKKEYLIDSIIDINKQMSVMFGMLAIDIHGDSEK